MIFVSNQTNMGITREQLEKIARQIDAVIDRIQQQEADGRMLAKEVSSFYKDSAINLMHYTAFRSFDARKKQILNIVDCA